VFDILPLYGFLQPGDTEQVTMTFYGHANIWGEVKAVCEVEGGPTYEIMLTGEASLVDYKFDCKEIDFGKQLYDHVASAEIKRSWSPVLYHLVVRIHTETKYQTPEKKIK
jgi:hydrocephalus-inducing protein